jgi:hypothetical protein
LKTHCHTLNRFPARRFLLKLKHFVPVTWQGKMAIFISEKSNSYLFRNVRAKAKKMCENERIFLFPEQKSKSRNQIKVFKLFSFVSSLGQEWTLKLVKVASLAFRIT